MTEDDPALSAVVALADPVRRELYAVMRASGRPLGRDELAERTGIPRATVAFHLEKLLAAGVLATHFAHRGDRRGPGSGRPAKFYTTVEDEFVAAVPPRRYELAAELLATAIERSDSTGEPVRDCLLAVAAELGAERGDRDRPLVAALTELGYRPAEDDDGGYRLTNCPFHRLAGRHTDLICSTNVAFASALSEESSDHPEVTLQPWDGGCCVRVGHAGSSRPAG
jgi:predicted ArsR family transcriptional regulator